MSARGGVAQHPDERLSRVGIFVLGMHRSGTSALTGALKLCGVHIGDETELTGSNIENPQGFMERRDVREICDQLLHSAGADWWKIADFELANIPYTTLTEQRHKFKQIVSALDKYAIWGIKEPRLCLLFPLLRYYVINPVCVYIYRNPVEVARSLRERDGFSISGGIALWEAYNLHALESSKDVPRIWVSHESLMSDPVKTLNAIIKDLGKFVTDPSVKMDNSSIEQFIDPALYRQKATDEDVEDHLTPSQRELWLRLRNGEDTHEYKNISISRATKQSLLDLESIELKKGVLEDEAARLQSTLKERDGKISVLESEATRLHGKIGVLEDEAARLQSTLKERDGKINLLEGEAVRLQSTLKELYSSTCWKITSPLRAIVLGLELLRKNLYRTYGTLLSSLSRVIDTVRSMVVESKSNTISYHRNLRPAKEQQLQPVQMVSRKKHVEDESKTKITVIAWDLGHNPLGRTYLLADILRRDYEVELIGANFPRFGDKLWEPLRHCSRVTIKSFPGANFPDHFRRMENVADQIDGDILYVSKPRLPSLELAILTKLQRNRPIILDIDDYELGFFKNRVPLTLDEVKTRTHEFDFMCPHDEIWTRYSESLIPLFEQITVSNEELQKKFGGMILPHIRDEFDFEPAAYPRDEIRAEFGFTSNDRVIIFIGTPRVHKGIARITAALENLDRSEYKLLIVGSPADNEACRFLSSINPARVKIVPNILFRDLPRYLSIGDLICLLQAEDNVISHFQMPAKITDGLSMGIPMLVSSVPPLMNLAREGLVELLDGVPLEHKIHEIFTNYDTYKYRAMQNRETFLCRYSYEANLPKLKDMIGSLLNRPEPVPDGFQELVDYHRDIFSAASKSPRTTIKTVEIASESPPMTISSQTPITRVREAKSYIDEKIDIVFFWKQNDTNIYGRRQDMLVKYLAEDPRISRIFHFDAPIDIFKASHDFVNSTVTDRRFNHARQIVYQLLMRNLHLMDKGKTRFYTFISARHRKHGIMKWLSPFGKDYLDYLNRIIKRHLIGQRRTIFWVFPNNFDFPSIADRFDPDLIVTDIVDDQRTWPSKPEYKEMLHRNYGDIIARSDLVFANCRSVIEGMRNFTDDIHLFPNAAELLEQESRFWQKPKELRRLKGPVIGYVGNLDILRIDLDLMKAIASTRPDWNLVFIGSMHRSGDILQLNEFENVHFLGVRPYEKALRYIRHFDVAIIPHLDNDLTRNMNPLKLYVYFSLHVPVVTTPIQNVDDFEDLVHTAHTTSEFIEKIYHCLNNDISCEQKQRIRNLLEANCWERRIRDMMALIETAFDTAGLAIPGDDTQSGTASQ